MGNVIIVGAGAAGMMAAYSCAKNGHTVTILEKNEKCGKKLYITGKGRCNITNNCDADDFFERIVTNSKFMFSAFYHLTNLQTMDLFANELGLEIKVERGGRVFPDSDKSSDVIYSLTKALKRLGVTILLGTKVQELLKVRGRITGVIANHTTYQADAVIVTTGGLSYSSTGSNGDGYHFAKQVGHNIVNPMPALVPMETKESWIKELQGLSLKNVSATFYQNKKKLYYEFGEMLFTHYGVSGPLILTASSYVGSRLSNGPIDLMIDLKPALTFEQLEKRILREFEEQSNCIYKNVLGKLLPRKLIPIMVKLTGISPEKPIHSITKKERTKLLGLIKEFPLTITKLRDFNEAIITKGGISVKEINPGTLESKLCKGLYFAGEVLDIDAITGGYNLQLAWSTGHLAGNSVPL